MPTSTATRPIPAAHRETTGPEIWAQTGGRLTHFVAAMGTTGTMMGTGGFLKERNPAISLIGVQPDSPVPRPGRAQASGDDGEPAGALRSRGARRGGGDPDRDGRPDRALAGAESGYPGRLVGRRGGGRRRWTSLRPRARRPGGGDRLRHRRALPERAAPVGGPVTLRLAERPASTRSGATARRRIRPSAAARSAGRVTRPGDKEVVRLAPAVNRRTDDPHRYLIAPDDLRRLEAELRARRARDRRLLSLASRSPGRAVGLRYRARLAVVQLSDRAGRPRARPPTLASWVLDDERPVMQPESLEVLSEV